MAGLTSLEQDSFLHIVPFIGGGPSALLQLGHVSKFFGARPTPNEPSLVEALAREMMETMDITDEEKARIPNPDGDSLLGVYNEFLKLRKVLEFGQVVGRSEVHEASHYGNEVYSNCNDGPEYAPTLFAIGNEVMKAGKHYVTFKRVGQSLMLPPARVDVGLIRPIDLLKAHLLKHDKARMFQPWNEQHYPSLSENNRTSGWGEEGKVDYCLFQTDRGSCFYGYWDNPTPTEETETLNEWPGKDRILPNEDCGLLLDVDEGTLTVYKDGKRLGVIMDGLVGEFSWCVMVHGTGLRMERAEADNVGGSQNLSSMNEEGTPQCNQS